ncbi:MAG: phosphoglycerate dehydrogenase, partial [Candidatus Neomarinimicrobiota bacterium]
ITDPLAPEGLRLLEEKGFEPRVLAGKEEADFGDLLSRAVGWIVRSGTRVEEQDLNQAPRLRVIGRAGVGLDNIDTDAAAARGIAVVNTPEANSLAVAEHTVGLMLALARHLPFADRDLRAGNWDRSRWVGVEVAGKTAGIIGMGKIGSLVKDRLSAFGMKILVTDPFLEKEGRDFRLVPLETLLCQADFISIHVPLTPDTRRLLTRKEINLMKPGAYLINVSRGGIIDETALAEALQAGKLAGAAVDVFCEEPLPEQAALRQAPRCLLTPHLGASTREAKLRVSTEICARVVEILQQSPVP